MYHTFFGLRRAPFQQRPDPRSFVDDERVRVAGELLGDALAAGEGIVTLGGASGVGKSALLQVLMERRPHDLRLAYVDANAHRPEDLLDAVGAALGLPASWRSGQSTLPQALVRHLSAVRAAGVRPALVLDQCDDVDTAILEQIRVVSDQAFERQRLLPLALCAAPAFDRRLQQPGLRALRSRIVRRIVLAPLTRHQAADYLALRLRRSGYYGPDLFPRAIAHSVNRHGQGLPRHINALADATLLAAFVDGTYTLTRRHVHSAVSTVAQRSGSRTERRRGQAATR